jgi:pyruvate dehydrogenase E2 component (dihydrolipoamide acetyltransferase)
VAVDTPRGLIVPVIRDVDRKSMAELSLELAETVQKAQAGETALEDLQGGTFTVTNPGPLGGTSFTPIINYPEAAILGMGRASWQPVVQGKGSDAPIVPRYVLPLVLAFDHRLNDGADAARFMSLIVKMLADPHEFLMNI